MAQTNDLTIEASALRQLDKALTAHIERGVALSLEVNTLRAIIRATMQREADLKHDIERRMAISTHLATENERFRKALEHYRRLDDETCLLLAGLKGTPNMRDPNSIAGKALDHSPNDYSETRAEPESEVP